MLIDIRAKNVPALISRVSINDKTARELNEPRNKHENTFQKTMRSFIDRRTIKY